MALSALFCTCFCALAFGVAHADVASQKRARFGLKGLEYNVDGYDKHGYDVLGFDTEGYDTLGRPVTDEFAGTGTGMDCPFARVTRGCSQNVLNLIEFSSQRAPRGFHATFPSGRAATRGW
jgi:hypothetical protein